MRGVIVLVGLLLWCPHAVAQQQAVMTKDSIACWDRQDFMALVRGEYRMNYWGSHQQKRDFMAQGRCFAVRKGERVTVDQLVKNPLARMAKLRRSSTSRSFWTDQGFNRY
jgi:hypothetical protein